MSFYAINKEVVLNLLVEKKHNFLNKSNPKIIIDNCHFINFDEIPIPNIIFNPENKVINCKVSMESDDNLDITISETSIHYNSNNNKSLEKNFIQIKENKNELNLFEIKNNSINDYFSFLNEHLINESRGFLTYLNL